MRGEEPAEMRFMGEARAASVHLVRAQKKRRNYERITHSKSNGIHRKIQKTVERACWKDECR
jgi:hypothetical protein